MKSFVFNPAFAKMTGSINAGLFLGYLMTRSSGEWYEESISSICENTGLSKNKFFPAKDILCKNDFVKCKTFGMPAKNSYKLNIKKIEAELKKYQVDISSYNHFENKQTKKEQPKKKDKFEELLSQIPKEKRDGYKEIHIKILRDFYEYRKAKKPINTYHPFVPYLKELKKIQDAGYKPMEAIELMKEKQWQTLKLEWVENEWGKKTNEVSHGGNYTW